MRAAGVVPGTFQTVTSYLSWDHDRLDAILAGVSRRVDDGRMEDALAAYRGFRDGLARHIRREEELLFPLFEARTGVVSGPTATTVSATARNVPRTASRTGLRSNDGAIWAGASPGRP